MAKPESNTPLLEWIAAALGATALATVLGVIVYGMATRGATPPTFHFDKISISNVGDQWHVGFRITNSGDVPASAVKVAAELSSGGEVAEITMRYVPDRSTREAGLYFRNDPRTNHVSFRVVGYEVP